MEQLMVEPYIVDPMLEHDKHSLTSWHFKLPAGKRTV